MIYVTKPFLPPDNEYMEYVSEIMVRGWLTNQGPNVLELESQLKRIINTPFINFVSNGTVAIQLGLRTVDILEGEIITTPFSYVATVSSILWERCTPVFVDIEPNTYCIDAGKIEAAITARTRAVMGVHVFGYPCDVQAIELIAKMHSLKVIYDGAHAFAVNYLGKPLLDYGDIATCSFHATKLFHTIEGGCVITHNQRDYDNLSLMMRFGHNNDTHIQLGINAKNSELHAAMGLCNLKYVPEIINKRRVICEHYDRALKDIVERPRPPCGLEYNYAYYPILLKNEACLLEVVEALKRDEIYPRRYFFPSLNLLPYLKSTSNCPISENIASRILCLPLYFDLPIEDVERISSIVKRTIS
jgi:dTDP-4-amino-4,6-dideoxygalactose transaminase